MIMVIEVRKAGVVFQMKLESEKQSNTDLRGRMSILTHVKSSWPLVYREGLRQHRALSV